MTGLDTRFLLLWLEIKDVKVITSFELQTKIKLKQLEENKKARKFERLRINPIIKKA